VPEKGVDTLSQALSMVGGGVRLKVAGYGPLEAALRGQEGVELVGRVDYEAVPDFLRSLDVLVLPSRTTPLWKEQFGRVLAEAMACGVPCLGSDSGAIPQVMGAGGLVFKEGDAQDLARQARRLRSGVLRARLGKEGRRRALAHYTHEVLGQRLGILMRRVLGLDLSINH